MKIVHVTLARVNRSDPDAWLNHLAFFTGILGEMSKGNDVESIHLMNCSQSFKRNNVLYHILHIRWWEWIISLRLSKFVAKRKPQVVIVHGLIFTWQLFWLRLYLNKGIKLFIQHHAEAPFLFPKNVLQRAIDRSVRGYFFSSTDLAKSWIDAGQIRDEHKIHQVLELSSPFYTAEKERSSGFPKTYLWVGRLDENKDPITLVHAFIRFVEHQPDAVLHVIFRGGHLLSAVEEILGTCNCPDKIILVGSVDHGQIEMWYDRSTFIVSTSHYESTGAAVCEAMSCGCIPILTNIPAFRTMTRNGDVGLLYEAGNADALVATLVRSTSIDIALERGKVFDQFKRNLSFQAIGNKILQVISGG